MITHFLAFSLLMLTSTAAFAAEIVVEPQIEPAKIRGDGALIDDDAMIIGIRNANDPRATEYEFYYLGVSEEGDVTSESVYKVYQRPGGIAPDFVQERLVPLVEDHTEILYQSSISQNRILAHDGNLFFNGKQIESGDVINGGVVSLVGDDLYYNGAQIESGSAVMYGEVAR